MPPSISLERPARIQKPALLGAALGLLALTGARPADAQQPSAPPPPPPPATATTAPATPPPPPSSTGAPTTPPPAAPGAVPPDGAAPPAGGYPPPQGGYPPGYGPYGPYGYPYGGGPYYGPAPYYPEPTPAPPPTKRANGTLMAAGIIMTSVGAIGVLSGLATFASANNRIDIYGDGGQKIGTRDDEGMQVAAAVLMIGGGVVGIAGIPMWVIGGKRVPLDESELPKESTTPGAAPSGPGAPPAGPGAPGAPSGPAQPLQPLPPPPPSATLSLGLTGASFTLTF